MKQADGPGWGGVRPWMRLGSATVCWVMAACVGGDAGRVAFTPPPTPTELTAGEALFNLHCSRCHGVHAVGTDSGPSLVHEIYRPSHHGDEAFTLAVRVGVAAHHWRFGDMPPQPQVADSLVPPIRDYVRWLQRSAGVR
ncbi:MAG TPA: c-type cytochrome [Gemmatimonadaceae bacterium]|nr:c-type cytochrome [Gemmatimonadaceae bacterium]